MSDVKICCHCLKPIVLTDGARAEFSISSRVEVGGKARIVHEHYACAVKADQPLSREAYDAIFEAERSGVA